MCTGGVYPRRGCPETWEEALENGWVLEVMTFQCVLCTLQRLHDLVLPLAMGVQQGEVLGSSPYSSSCCRRELYRLLLALLLAPSPRCPPPLSCALQAFSLGQREHSLEVSAERAPVPSGSQAQARDTLSAGLMLMLVFSFHRSPLFAQKHW